MYGFLCHNIRMTESQHPDLNLPPPPNKHAPFFCRGNGMVALSSVIYNLNVKDRNLHPVAILNSARSEDWDGVLSSPLPVENLLFRLCFPTFWCIKRRFFRKSCIFCEKCSKHSDQAFAKKCSAAMFCFESSSKIFAKKNRILMVFGYVMRQNIAKYKEE